MNRHIVIVLAIFAFLVGGAIMSAQRSTITDLRAELEWQRSVSAIQAEAKGRAESDRDGWQRSFETTAQSLVECSMGEQKP